MRATATGIVLCLGMLAMGCAAPTTDQIDEQAIKSMVADFAKSWNLPGMPGFGDLFTEDADFVVISGKWLKGRDEIVDYHRALLADVYKDSQLFVDSTTIRFLRPDSRGASGLPRVGIAVAHTAWGVIYTKDGKEQHRTTLAVLIFAKARGKWRIAAVQNTLTAGDPVGIVQTPNRLTGVYRLIRVPAGQSPTPPNAAFLHTD
jgi:uncharacterized protein (TIGR02246 family)